jgi:hypothetical protein
MVAYPEITMIRLTNQGPRFIGGVFSGLPVTHAGSEEEALAAA